ncbi:hypothetical protein T05_1273 [Trichinella murrelli]|uniref:Uncharacterized protein n=1 Tax=Trichinella murrelli TaxID=144512 RepID=A0A0V0TZW7_9BILA|nr:hypothetical protein T05_1273 [Trichinella murrelli]
MKQRLNIIRCIIKRAGFVSISDVPTKIASLHNIFAISRQIRVRTTCDQDVLSSAQVSYPSLTSRLKSHHCTTFLQYLGKYAFVRLATRFWKVPWQTNTNLLNKWHLKFACAYHNTQESSPSGTPLKRL